MADQLCTSTSIGEALGFVPADDRETLRVEIPQRMQTARRWLVWKSIPTQGAKPRKAPFYLVQ